MISGSSPPARFLYDRRTTGSFIHTKRLASLRGQAFRRESPYLYSAQRPTSSAGSLSNEVFAYTSGNANVTKGPHLIEASRRFGRFSTADWIVAGSALFIICNGISVCIGWWLRIPILVQLFPDAPTHFNTALLFILLGVGELGLVLRRQGVVMAMAVVVTCIASAELAEYALRVNMGIDTLLAVPFVGGDAPYPGRMSGNTIACFIFICAAQVLMSKPDTDAGAATTAAVILKSLAGGIAFLAMLGYLVGLKSAYGWTDSVGMSIRSGVGFLLIFIARIAALWQRDIVDKPSLPNWFLPFLTVAVGTISIGLIWIFASPLVRPFMLDPLYGAFAHRVSVATALSTGTLIFLGTISVLVARHKAVMARVSEKKLSSVANALRVTQARLESTLEASSVGTWTWDLATDRLIADEFTARMFSIAAGAAAQGLPVATYLQVVREEDRAHVAGALERAIQLCGAYDIEYRVLRPEGSSRWLQARGRVESDGAAHAAYFHGAVIDITDRKLAELSLRDKNQQLERSNRDLEDFAYIASHDLKTPLVGIKSAALWLEEDLQNLSDESRKLLGLMRGRIDRMESLLDNLLAYSRIGRTDSVAETKFADIFASIIEVLNPPAHIQVRVEGELPAIVTASAQLEQVLRNLINNAIKHHDKPKGEVVLSAMRVGDFVEFIVRDDGPGIQPQFHEKIFELFQTLKRRDEVESTGMGLAIVKKLIERQNCRISVHSQGNGTGTEFRFQWPTSSNATFVKEPTNA
jgi:PAS domain S-box-containing protein